MAVLTAYTMADGHEDTKSLHTFFSETSRLSQTLQPIDNMLPGPSIFKRGEEASKAGNFSAQGHPNEGRDLHDENIQLPQLPSNPQSTTHLHSDAQVMDEQDINLFQRKRQKTEILPNPAGTAESRRVEDASAKTIDNEPKKTLRLNPKTGTIGSPPPVKVSKSSETRSKKSTSVKRSKRLKSLIVTMKYGHDGITRSSIGQRIDSLLLTTKPIQSVNKHIQNTIQPVKTLETVETKKTTVSSKSTHPFFLGKAALQVPILKANSDLVSESLPAASSIRSKFPTKKPITAANFSGFSAFRNPSKMVKFPGALEPIWPPKDMLHVRVSSESSESSNIIATRPTKTPSARKLKYAATETTADEDILKIAIKHLDVNGILEELKEVDEDRFPEPEKCLRIPQKHFESGISVQRRIRHQITSPLPIVDTIDSLWPSEDELHGDGEFEHPVHPALANVYSAIPSSLTAFDQSIYETRSWIHKYAPTVSGEVLQSGREAYILKEWLQTLTVLSVDTSKTEPRSRTASVGPKQSALSKCDLAGKRKRKVKKLDGFIVSSGEEDSNMNQISEPEEDISMGGNQGLLKKTVIRAGDIITKGSKESSKLKNAVVISGPSGCGKTAAVYAVAKELGFEVFEINSSSRRSGKDIMERVGDMTRNHLVQHLKQPAASEIQDVELQRVSDALDEDLKSGRQGTMNNFFVPQKDRPSKPTEPPKVPAIPDDLEAPEKIRTVPKASKQQKQSLILLEEVDVLYDEDKQFWATVMSLIAQSKRPVIMTCNDEALVPLHALPLHAIIRLTPPSVDLAVDYMLLVAAKEGHTLEREAVKGLYENQRCDLRASMTELEFWCQIGVGDRRGGFEWFQPRLPVGIDKDCDGNTIRVVSEGTYKKGMGWLGQDLLGESCSIEIDAELMRQTWDDWQVDTTEHQDTQHFNMVGGNYQARMGNGQSSLESYEALVEAMSAADICGCGQLGEANKILLDTGTPTLSTKAREDYIIGYPLLQADTIPFYDSLAKDISFSIISEARRLAKRQYQGDGDSMVQSPAETEAHYISLITNTRLYPPTFLTRQDLSFAFDPIAIPEKTYVWSPTSMEPSIFDRTMKIIVTDVAPYVRSIVAYDTHLQQERVKLSNLLSEGGRPGKRMRTTRAALSALEGGKRTTTRRERWFGDALNRELVLRTGLPGWQETVGLVMQGLEAEQMLLEEQPESRLMDLERGARGVEEDSCQ